MGRGESLSDVAARLRILVAGLRAEFADSDQVLLVSHGDTLRVLVAILDGGGHRDVDWATYITWPNGHVETRALDAGEPGRAGRSEGTAEPAH